MQPVEVMIDDLGRQIAQKSIECAEWRARALTAEAAVAQIKQEMEEAEADEPTLTVVEDEE